MRILALCGLILAAASMLGARSAQAAPWCSTHGGMSCGYYTFDQCLAAIRGVGGSCVQNPAERPGERSTPAKSRRDAKPKREPEKKPAAAARRDKPSPRRDAVEPLPKPPAPVAEPQQSPTSPTQPAVKSFAEGRMLILSGKYEAGIAAMLALGYDDHPDVAVSIGYANSKLGRFDEARRWYEKALTADPNHVSALANYGLLRVEQGDVQKARDDLEKIKAACGTNCREYRELAGAIAARTR
jgi:predicted Zn-dependent protease